MLGATRNNPSASAGSAVNVTAIPAEFYAGANPVIKFREVEKEVVLGREGIKRPTENEKALLNKAAAAAGKGRWWHPANIIASRRFFLIASGVLFVVFIIGASVYYWRQAAVANKQAVAAAQQIAESAKPIASRPAAPLSAPEEAAPGGETAKTEEPVQPVEPSNAALPSLGETPIEFPSRLLSYGPDLDNDDLTDAEEESFTTDPGNPDTDGDKYADGHEVYYLYNPNGKEPMKLVDSGSVLEFQNPVFGYKLYFPRDWAVGNVDQNYRQVLFSTLTGENIEVRALDIEEGEFFADWFGRWAPGQMYGELQEFSSVFQEKGWNRDDYLVYYFTDNRRVYTIVYHTTDSDTVNYRSIVKMMARSFKLTGNNAAIPAPIVEGESPSSL